MWMDSRQMKQLTSNPIEQPDWEVIGRLIMKLVAELLLRNGIRLVAVCPALERGHLNRN